MANTQSNIKVSFSNLRDFIQSAMESQGLPKADALKVASLMAEAAIQGSDGLGCIRLAQYINRILPG